MPARARRIASGSAEVQHAGRAPAAAASSWPAPASAAGRRVAGCSGRAVEVDALLERERVRFEVAVERLAGDTLHRALDRPREVGHLVAREHRLLEHRAFLHAVERCRAGTACARCGRCVGRQRVHRPLACRRRWRSGCAAAVTPKLSVISKARHAVEPADRQTHRHDEPVVAERQRELGDRQAQQIGDARLGAGEVDVSVLELPVALGRHAGIAHRRRMARCDREGAAAPAARAGSRLRRAKVVPVDVAVGVFVGFEPHVAGAQRERVLHAVALPRRLRGIAFVEQRRRARRARSRAWPSRRRRRRRRAPARRAAR